MKKPFYLIGVLLVILLFYSCGNEGETESSQNTVPEDVNHLVLKVIQSMDAVLNNGELPSGLTSVISSDKTSITMDFNDVKDTEKGYTANGKLSFAGTLVESTMTMVMTGTLNLSGGSISTLVFNLIVVDPWDSINNDFSGEPSSITGTVTADGKEYNINEFIFLKDGYNIATDPKFIIACQKLPDGPGYSLIAYSKNGSQWGYPNISQHTVPAEDLNDIACSSEGDCVSVGDNGAVFYASDGITWSTGTSNATTKLLGVAYGSNRWVAVGKGQ